MSIFFMAISSNFYPWVNNSVFRGTILQPLTLSASTVLPAMCGNSVTLRLDSSLGFTTGLYPVTTD